MKSAIKMDSVTTWILRIGVPVLGGALGFLFYGQLSLRDDISNVHLTLTKEGAQAQLDLLQDILENRDELHTETKRIELESKIRDGEVYNEVLKHLIAANMTVRDSIPNE